MTFPTRRELQRLANETGFQELSLEKMIRLYDILQAIERDERLRDRLALKGGAALNAFHFNINRLSLDIDLFISTRMRKMLQMANGKSLCASHIRARPAGKGRGRGDCDVRM